jgi:hypothetical protein
LSTAQIIEIFTDCLRADLKLLCQIINQHLPFQLGLFQNRTVTRRVLHKDLPEFTHEPDNVLRPNISSAPALIILNRLRKTGFRFS